MLLGSMDDGTALLEFKPDKMIFEGKVVY